MSAANPVSPKMVAATAGAGVGSVLSTLVIWLLGVLVWHQPPTSSGVDSAVGAVPTPVAGFVALVITAGVSAASGWKVTDPNRVTTDELARLRSVPKQE